MSNWKYIPMRPFGKARPRVTANGTFMPKGYMKSKRELSLLYGVVDEFDCIRLSVVAIRKIPRNGRSGGDIVTFNQYCKVKPDLDNIVGAVMDTLFPESDSQVVEFGTCKKLWGDSDAIVIKVEEA